MNFFNDGAQAFASARVGGVDVNASAVVNPAPAFPFHGFGGQPQYCCPTPAPFYQPSFQMTPFIEGACGPHSFMCSQRFTGSKLAACCSGFRHHGFY